MTYGHDLIVTLIQTKQCPIHDHDQEVQQVTNLHESEIQGCCSRGRLAFSNLRTFLLMQRFSEFQTEHASALDLSCQR